MSEVRLRFKAISIILPTWFDQNILKQFHVVSHIFSTHETPCPPKQGLSFLLYLYTVPVHTVNA